jgi:hypothetical protein
MYNITVIKSRNIETAKRLILISKSLEFQSTNVHIPDKPNNKKIFKINEKINELKYEIIDFQGYIYRPWEESELSNLSPGTFSGVRHIYKDINIYL